jgi:hypothetical protein
MVVSGADYAKAEKERVESELEKIYKYNNFNQSTESGWMA